MTGCALAFTELLNFKSCVPQLDAFSKNSIFDETVSEHKTDSAELGSGLDICKFLQNG